MLRNYSKIIPKVENYSLFKFKLFIIPQGPKVKNIQNLIKKYSKNAPLMSPPSRNYSERRRRTCLKLGKCSKISPRISALPRLELGLGLGLRLGPWLRPMSGTKTWILFRDICPMMFYVNSTNASKHPYEYITCQEQCNTYVCNLSEIQNALNTYCVQFPLPL